MSGNVFSLRSIAPRLARARDQFLELQDRKRWWQRQYESERLRLQRLIAHRELQELRAGHVNDRRYVNRRHDKLARARADLLRLERVHQERQAAA